MKRQSLVNYGAPLAATEAPLPVPQGSEVLVRIANCGVCHSDLHLQDGYFDLGDGKELDVRSLRSLPFTLGHEIAGYAVAAGPEAGAVDQAALHAVYPWIGCGACGPCRRGDEHLCDKPRHLGITVDGGFATHVLVPHPRYLIDASGVDPALAGLAMCSGVTAYSALRKARGYFGATPSLMIVGLGGVGMMGLEIARATTDARILAADIAPAKREASLALGAAAAFDPSDSGARKAVFQSGGAVDAAIDFAGSDASLAFAQSVVGKGGAVIVVGLMGGRFSLPVPMFPLRELTITGSFTGPLAHAKAVVALAREGKLRPIPMHARPLAEASQALDDLRAGKVVGRTVLRP
jgi:D-arabinose 1-dehydrogenase-like Zn-dependent alcohol dehydrogenase